MKKRLFALLLAVTVAATTVPVYAGTKTANKKAKVTYKTTAEPILPGDPEYVGLMEAVGASSSVSHLSQHVDALSPIEMDETILSLFGIGAEEKDVIVSDLDGVAEETAELNAKLPTPGKASPKILNTYDDEIDFSLKPAKNAERYVFCLYSDKSKIGKIDPSSSTQSYYTPDVFATIAAPDAAGKAYSISKTASNVVGKANYVPGKTFFLSIMTVNSLNPQKASFSGGKKFVVPDAPNFSMTMVPQVFKGVTYPGWLKITTTKFYGGLKVSTKSKITGKFAVNNYGAYPMKLKQKFDDKMGNKVESGIHMFNTSINEPGKLLFKANKASINPYKSGAAAPYVTYTFNNAYSSNTLPANSCLVFSYGGGMYFYDQM